jgi:hypothetical protein
MAPFERGLRGRHASLLILLITSYLMSFIFATQPTIPFQTKAVTDL